MWYTIIIITEGLWDNKTKKKRWSKTIKFLQVSSFWIGKPHLTQGE